MKVLRSYVCRPSDVVSVFFSEGILNFTMSASGCWKRIDWDVFGEANFKQELQGDNHPCFEQELRVDIDSEKSADYLTDFNDICEIYAAHFTDDGRVFFQGFEAVTAEDRILTPSVVISTTGRYFHYKKWEAGSFWGGLFIISGNSRSLATLVSAEFSAMQEQFLEKV